MRAKLLESDSNENGESRDDFEEYRPTTPTPPAAQNGTVPSVTGLTFSRTSNVIIHMSGTSVNYE